MKTHKVTTTKTQTNRHP